MRIISGKLRGRQLVEFSEKHIRPTTDRVKETVFNILMMDVPGARVLDLFSGTGNLGFEAYSRGALLVDMVERNPRSLAVIEQNIKKLAIDGGVNIFRQDVFEFIKQFKGQAYDIVLIDPPFTEKWGDQVMICIADSEAVSASAIIVLEASSQETIAEQYGDFIKYKERHFGDKVVFFFKSSEDRVDLKESDDDGGISR